MGWQNNKLVRQIVVPLVSIIIFLILWELLVWWRQWPNYKMASPSDLTSAYQKYWKLFLLYGWQTLWRTVLGLLISVLVGTSIGMIMGFSRIARDALYPLLVGFNAVPKATVVPVIALLFIGADNTNTVLEVFVLDEAGNTIVDTDIFVKFAVAAGSDHETLCAAMCQPSSLVTFDGSATETAASPGRRSPTR